MPNGPQRAEFWRRFIADRCAYPAPGRLRAQLAAAEFHDFCACGCNSFAVRIPAGADVPPIAAPGNAAGTGVVFEADFALSPDKHLEVLLFVDAVGNLAHVDVTCCGNSFPVEDGLEIREPPYATIVSPTLLPD